jgi:hypothetical protein
MRSSSAVLTVALLGAVLGAAEQRTHTYTFGKGDIGKVPAGWKAERTGEGQGSVWQVVTDQTAPSKSGLVLAQLAESPNAVFNLCVVDDTKLRDVEISVAFKAMEGKKDQGGGVVWRYQDANNYYIARMNPLEDNYRVYKVVDGKRVQLETEEGVKVPVKEWHTLKVRMVGNRIECFLDGKKVLDAKDDTFKGPGKVGLWTKADARTYFDEFKVSGE